MLIQIEKSARKTYGGNVRSSAPRFAPGARHKSSSQSLSILRDPVLPFGKFAQAMFDVLAVVSAFLLVTVTGLGLAFVFFLALFCKF